MPTIWSLPEEIQVDIFLRLPVNSILACRCVCKFLFSLLSNPKFIKNHINLSIHNNNNPRLMYGYSQYNRGKNPIINSIDYESISSLKLKIVRMDYPFETKKTKAIATLGSCDGLICLGISIGGMGIEEKSCICVWNPSTGEYRNIKIPVCDFLPESVISCYVRYGFGYDSNIEDYKLVRISGYEYSGQSKKIEVYTLGGGSKCWRTTQRADNDHYMFPSRLERKLPGVLVDGVLHWSGSITNPTQGSSSRVIVCFDINNERLMDFPFPEDETMLPLQQHYNVYREVGVLGDCLCVVFSVLGIQMNIWVMKEYGVRESWSKVFTTTQQGMTKDAFFKPIWSFENGGFLVYALGKLSLCDQNQNNGKTGEVLLFGINMSRYPESYVESLVSVKSGTYVKKRTTIGKKKPKRQRLRSAWKFSRIMGVSITEDDHCMN